MNDRSMLFQWSHLDQSLFKWRTKRGCTKWNHTSTSVVTEYQQDIGYGIVRRFFCFLNNLFYYTWTVREAIEAYKHSANKINWKSVCSLPAIWKSIRVKLMPVPWFCACKPIFLPFPFSSGWQGCQIKWLTENWAISNFNL